MPIIIREPDSPLLQASRDAARGIMDVLRFKAAREDAAYQRELEEAVRKQVEAEREGMEYVEGVQGAGPQQGPMPDGSQVPPMNPHLSDIARIEGIASGMSPEGAARFRAGIHQAAEGMKLEADVHKARRAVSNAVQAGRMDEEGAQAILQDLTPELAQSDPKGTRRVLDNLGQEIVKEQHETAKREAMAMHRQATLEEVGPLYEMAKAMRSNGLLSEPQFKAITNYHAYLGTAHTMSPSEMRSIVGHIKGIMGHAPGYPFQAPGVASTPVSPQPGAPSVPRGTPNTQGAQDRASAAVARERAAIGPATGASQSPPESAEAKEEREKGAVGSVANQLREMGGRAPSEAELRSMFEAQGVDFDSLSDAAYEELLKAIHEGREKRLERNMQRSEGSG